MYPENEKKKSKPKMKKKGIFLFFYQFQYLCLSGSVGGPLLSADEPGLETEALFTCPLLPPLVPPVEPTRFNSVLVLTKLALIIQRNGWFQKKSKEKKKQNCVPQS